MTVPNVDNRLLSVLDDLIDDHVGIIRFVREAPVQSGMPRFFHYMAQACDTTSLSEQQNFSEAGGASSIRRVALAKAVGEAIERYCAALFRREELPFETYESAPFACVDPEEFALYTAEQLNGPNFPYSPFTKRTRVRWTEAFDALTGESWHVPAAMVYMPYYYDAGEAEESIAQPISTGLACHCSENEAAISALCEVVERDAFTITWQAMLPVHPLRLDSLSEPNRDLVRRFEVTGSEVRILNMTLEHGIPSILSMLMHSSSDAPTFIFAASAHLSPEIAIRKSLEELAHTQRLAATLKKQRDTPFRKQDAHVKLYTDHASRSAVEFLFASNHSVDFQKMPDIMTADPDRDLAILCERIASIGCKPLLKNLTTMDIADVGLSVVRAVIPGFHPLFMGHQNRALGGRRLWTVPQMLGYKGIRKEMGDNPAPHPFP